MAEQTAEAVETTETETETSETEGAPQEMPPELKAIIDKERKTARDAEKARKATEREMAELRQQTMTDAEKAIEQARTEARREAFVEVGGKVAAAEVRAAAAGRLEGDQLDALIDNLNLARFVDEAGDVDRDAITAFMNGIAPERETTTAFPDLGQGARQNQALNGDPLLRDLKSKLGIR